MKKIIGVLLVLFTIISCNETKKETVKKQTTEPTEEIAANLKSIEVDIEGMTCEIGCARTIQSKLSKVDGVSYSKVDFESKKGVFTFDSNKISKNDITKKIDGIAGGDVYFATKTTDLENIITEIK